MFGAKEVAMSGSVERYSPGTRCSPSFESQAQSEVQPIVRPFPPVLWCVHLMGPDTVHPTRTFEEAEQRALKINADIRLLAKKHGWGEPEIHAVVAIWPWTPESHNPDKVDWDGDLC